MLTAYYDLSKSPPTYDIVGFLLAAERHRLKVGQDRLSVCVLPGPAGGFRQDTLWPRSVEERQKMLHQVALPMARLLPSAAEVTVMPTRPAKADPWSIGFGAQLYGTRVMVQCLIEGCRPLRAPDPRPDPKLVTITLREAEHWPGRNSKVDQWVRAALRIKDMGYCVVVVRDALKAGHLIAGLTTMPEASTDLFARADLYASAAVNMFVNNGPAWFAMALDAPVLMLRPATAGINGMSSEAFVRRCGIPQGESIPCAPPYQRIVWADDDEESIVRSFAAFVERREVAYA